MIDKAMKRRGWRVRTAILPSTAALSLLLNGLALAQVPGAMGAEEPAVGKPETPVTQQDSSKDSRGLFRYYRIYLGEEFP